MPSKENYLRIAAVATVLTVAILLIFQLYIVREPARISADEARNLHSAITTGETLFTKNCATCHGDKGQGSADAPSLNNKQFLSNIDDGTIFSLVSSGVPNTEMPAWNQSHGGPLTDEDVRQLVAFVRSWQPNAPDQAAAAAAGNATRGAAIFAGTCFVCHGTDGKGTDRAPALNDSAHLSQFDDAWYRDTIMKGRPSKGMPTWGTVLSPAQINDIIALIDGWRAAGVAVSQTVTATATATGTVTATTATTATAASEVARPSNPGGAGLAVALTGEVSSGTKLYTDNCARCHGQAGAGNVANPGSNDGTIPGLNPIDATLANSDPRVFAYNIDLFMEHGSTPAGPSPKEKMPAWGDDKKLTDQQIADVIAYVISINPTTAVTGSTSISTTTPVTSSGTTSSTDQTARPSNPGGPGPALGLTADVAAGTKLYSDNCARCHGNAGAGGIANPGSTDGTIPGLNPIDSTLANKDPKVFAYNIDLFMEHGSTPGGPNPKETMPAWGDEKRLTAQQIADVIGYVISINK